MDDDTQPTHTHNNNSSNDYSSTAQVQSLLHKYTQAVRAALDGRVPPCAPVCGGARLRAALDAACRAAIAAAPVLPLHSRTAVLTALANCGGTHGTALPVPDRAFERLAQDAVARLAAPATACVRTAAAELARVLSDAADETLAAAHPALRTAVDAAAAELVERHCATAERVVEDRVAIEGALVNSAHPDFVGGAGAVSVAAARIQQRAERKARPQQQQQQRCFLCGEVLPSRSALAHEHINRCMGRRAAGLAAPRQQTQEDDVAVALDDEFRVELVTVLLESYLAVVKKSLCDAVPKTVMCFLVNSTVQELYGHLVTKLLRRDLPSAPF